MSNAAAVEAQLEGVDVEGHEALVELVRGLALAVDADPDKAALWREYREALTRLLEVVADGADDERTATVHRLRAPLEHAAES